METQKIIIVDDHKIFRKGLEIIINDYKFAEVIAGCATGEQFLEELKTKTPDIVFMDINMPGISGYEATGRALLKNKNISIIGMSAVDDIASIHKMLNAGAIGYLTKDVDYDEIHQAIQRLSEKKNYFSSNIYIKLTQNIPLKEISKRTRITENYNITKREMQVLKLICEGLSNHELSNKLNISVRTVEKHKASLYAKTNTENALNLVLFAFRSKLAVS